MLYWASFLGRVDILEYIIRLGFSPFMPAHDSKSALFAAVDGNQMSSLKLILSFNYTCPETENFEQGHYRYTDD